MDYEAELKRLYGRYLELTPSASPSITFADIMGHFEVVTDHPLGEIWVTEKLSPLMRAAGMKPRVLGKITNIG